MPAVELHSEKNIRGLRAPISHKRLVRRRLKVEIVQVDIAETVPLGGKVHQPSAILDELRDSVHKDEVAQMVGAKLRFEAILRLADLNTASP
jgi:hypothetical protein